MTVRKTTARRRRLKKHLTSESMAQAILSDVSKSAQTKPVKRAVLAGIPSKTS